MMLQRYANSNLFFSKLALSVYPKHWHLQSMLFS